MKIITHLALTIFTILLVTCAGAQTEKGALVIGGSTKLNFSSLNTKWKSDNSGNNPTNTSEIDLSPKVGMFIADDWLLGAEVPFNLTLVKRNGDRKNTDWSVALAPFVRYYWGETNIRPWVHGGIGLGFFKSKAAISSYGIGEVINDSYVDRSGMFLYDLGGGISIFLNENTALDIGLAYTSATMKPLNGDNRRVVVRGISAGIGFIFIL